VEPIEEPPENPEDWTDEQWIAWLEATDSDTTDQPDPERPATVGARVIRSAGGTVLGAAMTGVAEIFYENQEPDVVVVAEVPEGTDDQSFNVTLDPNFPERSVVTFRPPRSDDPDAGPIGDGPR